MCHVLLVLVMLLAVVHGKVGPGDMDHAAVVGCRVVAHHRMYRSLVLGTVVLAEVEDAAHQPLAGLRACSGRGDDSRDAVGHPGLVVRIPNNGQTARHRRSLGGVRWL